MKFTTRGKGSTVWMNVHGGVRENGVETRRRRHHARNVKFTTLYITVYCEMKHVVRMGAIILYLS